MRTRRRRTLTQLALAPLAAMAAMLSFPNLADAREGLFRIQREFLAIPWAKPGPSGTAHRICAAGTTTSKHCAFEPPTTGGTAICGVASCPPATLSYTGVGFGQSFKLPKSFLDVSLIRSCSGPTPVRGPCGYLGYSFSGVYDSANGPGHFQKSDPYGATTTTRVVFPTTFGNSIPNLGFGSPVTPTSTFSGRYDFYRAGSIVVAPGPNRFGGTMRMLFGAKSARYVLNSFSSPFVFKYYGTPTCQVGGIPCTSQQPSVIGQTRVTQKMRRFLTDGLGGKATYGSGTYLSRPVYYLNIGVPWTTGTIYASMPQTPSPGQKATYAGYDNRSVLTTTGLNKSQYQVGVLSLVRPRLVYGYLGPDMASPAENFFRGVRVERIKVHFLPEPESVALLAAGMAFLLALRWIR
jgi:hypothetical protein